jgi:hypothetical protein
MKKADRKEATSARALQDLDEWIKNVSVVSGVSRTTL